MFQNEPNAALRVVSDQLFAADGVTLLPLNTVFAAGDLKLVKSDGTQVNANHLPVPMGTHAGSFDFLLDIAEIALLGNLRLQLNKPGVVTYWEWIEPIKVPLAQTLLDAIMEGPLQYDGLGEASTDATLNTSVAEALRAILAYASGNATGLDGPNVIIKSRVGGRNRIAAQIQNGNRTITSRDES